MTIQFCHSRLEKERTRSNEDGRDVATYQSGPTTHAQHSNSKGGLHAVHLTLQHCGTACHTMFNAELLSLCAMPRRFGLCRDSITKLIIIRIVTTNNVRSEAIHRSYLQIVALRIAQVRLHGPSEVESASAKRRKSYTLCKNEETEQ